jgi:hypothetical protein
MQEQSLILLCYLGRTFLFLFAFSRSSLKARARGEKEKIVEKVLDNEEKRFFFSSVFVLLFLLPRPPANLGKREKLSKKGKH